MKGWIGVDLDGTLAKYDPQLGTICIGKPIPEMLARVKSWLGMFIEVRIFTARAASPEQIQLVEAWCQFHLGVKLPVTNVKDFAMIELWDDRAVAVEFNTGSQLTPLPAKKWMPSQMWIDYYKQYM